MTAIAAAAVLMSQSAAAQEFVNPDWANNAMYIGAAIGQSRANINDADTIRAFNAAGGAAVRSSPRLRCREG